MATMNVSLPDEMKQWVEERASTGQFANVSDYIRDVLRRERASIERFQALIDEAEASGYVDMDLDELFEDVKRRSREKILATAEEIRANSVKTDDAA